MSLWPSVYPPWRSVCPGPLPIFFLRLYLFIFRERGREGEREGVKHQCLVASSIPHTRDMACNPGMCPDWESNQHCFGSQARAQSIELHQPGLHFLNWVVCLSGVESYEFFMYFGDQSLVQGIIGKYIFLYGWFPFHFADVFFSCTEAF